MSGLQNLRPGQLLHASVLSDTSQNLVKLHIALNGGWIGGLKYRRTDCPHPGGS